MANITIQFIRNYNGDTINFNTTYSGLSDDFTLPDISAVPYNDGDIVRYADWSRETNRYVFRGWLSDRNHLYSAGEQAALPLETSFTAQWFEITTSISISYNNNIIFSTTSISGTQVLETNNCLMTDNITLHYHALSNLQDKTASPSTVSRTILPDTGYGGLNKVIIEAISPTKNQATYTPTTTDQIISGGQWLLRDQTIKGDANLIPANIKMGVSIFNVAGTYAGGGGDYAIEDLIQNTITSYANSTLTTVGSYKFLYCDQLETLSIPACTLLGASAFGRCSVLTTASFPNCSIIGSNAFEYCRNLTTAIFPECTQLNNYAFGSCYKLATISFPKCPTIPMSAFYSCSSLTTVIFPVCTKISSCAFYGCRSLNTVSFPKCTSIASSAFRSCYNLLSFYILTSTVPTLGTYVFTSTPISNYTTSTGGVYGSIFVKESLLASFKAATNWSAFSARMVGLTDAQIAALG